jgi:flagellar biosynthetic protein FlhB
MAEESDLEKTEAASPQKLEKAREEGQVARSRELGTFALLAVGGGMLWMMGDMLYRGMRGLLFGGLGFDRSIIVDPAMMVSNAQALAGQALWMVLPLFGMLVVIAVFSSVAVGGLVLSGEAIAPKMSKLSPVAGIKRMFSSQTMIELLKATAKAVLVGSTGGYVIWTHLGEMLNLMYAAPQEALARMSSVVALCAMIMIGPLFLIVMIDVPWQIWSHLKKMRMSKEDVKKEHKENEGDPLVKGRIRQQQRALARRRMMADVPSADVVVTNPTHYAVALKYSEQGLGAPRVVAKGAGEIAARIREIAREHRVPLLQAPPLARALHRHVEVGHEIPVALYSAVAEVLAWVFQLRAWRPGVGVHPDAPLALPVPKDMDPATARAMAGDQGLNEMSQA